MLIPTSTTIHTTSTTFRSAVAVAKTVSNQGLTCRFLPSKAMQTWQQAEKPIGGQELAVELETI